MTKERQASIGDNSKEANADDVAGIAAGQLRALVERMQSNEEITLASLVATWAATECWRPIQGFPEYAVSSFGRVRGPRQEILKQGRVHGYCTVSLSSGRLKHSARVHRLVAFAFLGAPSFFDAVVAHNDGSRTNNNVGNIRWASARENQRDRVRHGTHISGSKVAGAKLHENQIPTIRERIRAGERYPQIAASFGVSVSTISLIAKNKIWRQAGGAAWKTGGA